MGQVIDMWDAGKERLDGVLFLFIIDIFELQAMMKDLYCFLLSVFLVN